MNRRFLLAYLPAVVLLLLSGGFYWLLHTEPGARWVWARAVAATGGALQAGEVRGDIRSGISLQRLSYESETQVMEAPSVNLRVNFNLFPPHVSIEQFEADRVQVMARPIPDSASHPARPLNEVLPSLASPVPISVEGARIGELQVLDADRQTRFSASGLGFDARLSDTLEIRRAKIRTHTGRIDAGWELRGELDLAAPFKLQADLNGKGDSAQARAWETRAGFSGNIDRVNVEATLTEPAATVKGWITNVGTDPGFELNLEAPEVSLPLDAEQPNVAWSGIAAQFVGNLDQYRLQLHSGMQVIDLPELAVEAAAQGNRDGLQVESLRIEGEPVDLTATGNVTWDESLDVMLDTTLSRLAPSHWIKDWPDEQALHGKLSVGWAGERVSLSDVDIAAGDSGFQLTGQGAFDPEQDTTDASVSWSSFRWPLAKAGSPKAQAADFRSEQGEISLHGSLSAWRASGNLRLQAGEWPDGNVRLAATGDRESAQIDIEEGAVLGGSFDGNLQYRWSGTQSWSTEMRIHDLDLSALAASLPRSITGEWSASGQLQPLALEAELKGIRGELRGQPLRADGGITYRDGQLVARDLDIRAGTSNLSLDGNPESATGLEFSIHVADLGELLADAGGTINGQGVLATRSSPPRLEIDADATGVSIGDLLLGNLELASREPGLRLDISEVKFGEERTLEAVSLSTSGPNLFDRIELHVQQETTQWDLRLNGNAQDWPQWLASAWRSESGDTTSKRWHGQIESWSIEDETLGWLRLEAPAPLSFSSAALDVGPACLRGSGNGKTCIDAQVDGTSPARANARLDGVALSVLSLLTRSKIEFTQTLTGDIHFQRAQGELVEAEVDIGISPGEIRMTDSEQPLVTGAGRFAFRISGGQLLAGNLDMEFPGAGTIDTNFDVPDLSRGADSPVGGRIQISLHDIGPMLAFLPQLENASGVLHADVEISGNVSAPRFTGHSALVRGALEHKATGTVISNLQLAGAVYQFHHAELNGSFTAGEGQGQLKATLQFDDFFKPAITLDVAGNNLTLVNVPDMEVVADPDLDFYWHDGFLRMDGEIVVPRAKISPRYIPTATVSESADLVIVAGAPPPEEKGFFDRSRLRLNGSVGVELGDDVTVTLDRATAKLGGKTVFTWKDSLVPIADGHYTVSGKITAYGQLLEVSEGRINFPNIPADNPHLNIRAEREIYGNVQVRKAGVLLTGTVRQPNLEPYTTPATTGERAMTLLVTGHDFDAEEGVGGFEVGMYIAPRLYVSYGIGLFENQNVISARYEIKGGLGVRASSGQRETGADVSYTIER